MNRRSCYQVVLAMAFLSSLSLLRAADPISNQGPMVHSPTSVQFRNALRLTESGKLQEAERLVETGLTTEPMSLPWHLLKADLLARQDRPVELRKALETSYALAPENVEVLTRLAHCRDLYGDDAASIYAALAQRLQAQQAPLTQVISVLERALLTGLRDGDSEVVAGVKEKLRALGYSQAHQLQPNTPLKPSQSTLRIPGGIRALASVMRMPATGAPEEFVTRCAERVTHLVQGRDKPGTKRALEEFKDYFETLAALEAGAKSTGESFERWLDPTDEQTEKILHLLGWRLKQGKQKPLLELGDHPLDARRQVVLSALGVDQAAMKIQLESGRPFLLIIPSEHAALILDETFWLKQIPNRRSSSGQLLEAFLDHPELARLYAALGNLTEETRSQVLLAADAKALLNRYSDLLYAHADALLVEGGELVVPGGTPAMPFWEELAGASPRRPAQFIGSLLQKDDGKLLAYYHLMARLRGPNQQFFTRSAARLKTFFQAFPFSERRALKAHRFARLDVEFEELLRQLPLDAQGRVDFPGGPNVWRVSRAAANGPSAVRNSRGQPASAAEEDEILLRLLTTRYNRSTQQSPVVEAFLGLVRLQRHRHQAMDEQLAALLLQEHAKHQQLFPYLASLPELTTSEIALFFEAAKRLEGLDRSQLNLAAGEFHSLLQWLIVVSGSNALRDGDVARLFGELSRGFLHANTDADFAAHACQMVLKIASALQRPSRGHGGTAVIGSPGDDRSTGATGLLALRDVEDLLFRSVAGVPQEIEFAFGNRHLRVNFPAWRKQQMQQFLELQSIPSLNVLLAIQQSSHALSRGGDPAREAATQIGILLSELREPEPAAWQRLNDAQRKTMVATQKRDLIECLARIQKLLETGSQDIQSLATQLTGLLNPHVHVALLGWAYAFYFSPRDLIVASDPWFVRRHQFIGTISGKETAWAPTQLRSYASGGGSYLGGGLAQIAATAGEVGLVRRDADGSVGTDTASSKMAAMQLASVRSIPWAGLDEHGLRQVALKSLFGRELLAEAILDPKVKEELSEPLLHLIGLRRRGAVLHAMSSRDPAGAFRLLSTSDFYFLADSVGRRGARWTDSPLGNALEQEAKRQCSRQVSWFGGYQASDGCVRPHLVDLGPYEDHEGFQFRDRMAEKLSAIGLDLAVGAHRLGLPVDGLALIAEMAVHHVARRALMKDSEDWGAALQALRSLRLEPFLEHLEETP